MRKLPVSELNILSFSEVFTSEKAQTKFTEIFGVSPDFFYAGTLYLQIGEGIRHIVNNHLHFFIYGDIYENLDDVQLFNLPFNEKVYLGTELPNLNGSYVILIINKLSKSFQIITDRLNSKKIFLFGDSHFKVLSTNLLYFKNRDQKINISSIACYLVNGVVYNNSTLYEKTCVLERACLHTFSGNAILSQPYWKYEFTNEYANESRKELKKRFADLLLQGVNRRIKSLKPETCFLALSGGYDSRFLLGALRSMKSEFQLRTFSYGMDISLSHGDDILASTLARKFNFEHHFEKAYLHNFIKTISLNAEYGYGLSNFCDELDALLSLSDRFAQNSSSLLFVGDMYYLPSYNFKKIKDRRLLLYYSMVFPWYYIRHFLASLPLKNQDQLISAYEELFQNIVNRLPDTDDFQILKDFAYLDQRISHTLMYWRNSFYAPFIKVTQPLLDNDLLDFIRKLPDELRYNKILYKETLHEMFPDLFVVSIARNSWVYPSWSEEIGKNKTDIINGLIQTESKLDNIIPPDTILSLVNNDNNANLKYKIYKGIGAVARNCTLNNGLLNNLAGGIILRHYHILRAQLIIRLLVLREALKF